MNAGTTILTALISNGNLNTIINALVGQIPAIIDAVVGTIIEAIPAFIEAGFNLFVALISNLPGILVELTGATATISDALLQALADLIVKFEDMGGQIMQGLADGIVNAGDAVVSTAKESLKRYRRGRKTCSRSTAPQSCSRAMANTSTWGLRWVSPAMRMYLRAQWNPWRRMYRPRSYLRTIARPTSRTTARAVGTS